MRLTPTQKVKTPRKSVSLAQLLRSQSPHQLKEKGEENSNPFEKSEEQDESDSEMIQVRKSAFFKKKQDSYSKISSNKRQKTIYHMKTKASIWGLKKDLKIIPPDPKPILNPATPHNW